MQTNILNNKIRVWNLTNQEKMWLRKSAVGIKTDGSTLVLDDTLINRIVLGLEYDSIIGQQTKAKPADINPLARDYQVKDITRMLQCRVIFNRNKPGYGKTFEAIEYCRLSGLNRILIICPKSTIYQWQEQFLQWWPESEGYIHPAGAGPNSTDAFHKYIFITNYEQLNSRNVAPKGSRKKIIVNSQVWQRCKSFVWDIVIVDESHKIKGPTNQITIAIKGIPSVRRMCLSGTPILNHPDDLWSQLDFLEPRIAGNNSWAFKYRFCEVEDGPFGKKVIGYTPSEGSRELMTKVLSACTVGGDNESVTAGKNYIPINLIMDPKQRELYRDILEISLDKLDNYGITVKNAMDQIVKQQQVTTNCVEMFKDAGCKVNPKFDWIKDWLEDNEGEKAVVFSKFATTAKALNNILKTKSRLYTGDMDSLDRERAKKDFINNKDVRVIIGTIGAMGVSVDGFQKVCRNVIFLDRDWTPGLNEQAEDRVNRSGQVGMTNIWILNMKNSIDQHVDKIQGKKADDIKEVFKNVKALYST